MSFANQIRRHRPAIIAAVLLAPMGLWLIIFAWPQRHLYYRDYRFDETEAQRLAAYPRAMLAYGDRAWQRLASLQAATFYRKAVARDALYMDAWLRLAQIEASRGQLSTARKILAFVVAFAGHTSRWQSSIALLAHELGMENVFRRSVNFLLHHGIQVEETFNLLDAHWGSAAISLENLDAPNLPAYLKWLMRWKRVADARLSWRYLNAHDPPDKSILLKYIDFLVLHKIIDEARDIWQAHAGTSGVTNGDFEREPSSQGFDWRAYPSPERYWKIRHAAGEGLGNTWGLEVVFFGKANVDFHHLYQIVPLDPAADYRLSYGWRGAHLNTDQRPFVDLVGYDCDGFYARGEMLHGSSGWRAEQIEFRLPPDCNAVRLGLRRKPSNRFDNKLEGRLWLDDFRIESVVAQDRSK